MVDHVRDESPLEDVLRENNVDYLIVSFAATRVKEEGGCYEITQPDPEWAGRRTAKMRGEICSPPTERFVTPAGTHTWSVFPAIETLIWNVRDARWKARRMNNQTRRAISVRTKAGERVTYKIGPQNDAGAIARRLTLQIHRMVRGDTATETIGRLIIQPVELPRYQAASPSLVAYV